MIAIRPATLEDAPALAALLGQLGYRETQEAIRGRLGALCGRAESEVLVAEDGSRRITGCVHVLIDHRLAEGRRGEITGIVVDDQRRSRGTGARLVAAATAWMRDRGITRLRVRCNTVRGRAHRFYEKLGFRLTKTQTVFDLPIQAPSQRAAAETPADR